MIEITNHGPLIKSSNYWDSDLCAAGRVIVSPNAGALRILIPNAYREMIADMYPAPECVIWRGPWPAQRLKDAFEFLFDDGSAAPYAMHLSPEAFVGTLPIEADYDRELIVSVWTSPRRGKPHKALERPAWLLRAKEVPCLQPRPR